jgi:hypothetical protein
VTASRFIFRLRPKHSSASVSSGDSTSWHSMVRGVCGHSVHTLCRNRMRTLGAVLKASK